MRPICRIRSLAFGSRASGDDVLKGDLLGHLEDFEGAVLAQIHAPHDGRILYMTATLAAPAGCDLVALG